jgi:GTP pyrophosphokinase
VRVNTSLPLLGDGSLDVEAWLALISRRYQGAHFALIETAAKICLHYESKQSLLMAAILSELDADHETLIAALLYEAFRNELLSMEAAQDQFGPNVLRIVKMASSLQMVQDLRQGTWAEGSQAERFRKMILAMINDVRAVLLKLAECICIMRSIKALSPKRRGLLAQEILGIYAPIANRLGIGQMKWELEDRAFACLDPDHYFDISDKLHEKRIDRERYIEQVRQSVLIRLQEAGIQAQVSGRVKHIYSIWRKMQLKSLKFEQLFDIQALRILVPNVSACYVALACVNDLWKPIPSEFRDYIISPKSNGYRSIHSIVIGPEHKKIEVQIRTYAMHEESEKGMAAHWRYKEGAARDASLESRINWLRSLLEWQKMLGTESAEFEKLGDALVDEQVYVFTPQGEVIDLPKGATPLDFAYRVHTELGHRCQGAKVNGKLVPLNSVLQTTDRVEIVVGKVAKPSRNWLNRQDKYIATQQARKKIERWFRGQEATKPSEESKGQSNKEAQVEEFEISHKKLSLHKDDIIVYGVDNLLTRAAGCCRPIMGDSIMGYITQGRGISVHRSDCKLLRTLSEVQKDRLIEIRWSESNQSRYRVDLTIFAKNRKELLKDLTYVFAQEGINIITLQTKMEQDDTLIAHALIDISNTEQMQRILAMFRQIQGVLDVKRGR